MAVKKKNDNTVIGDLPEKNDDKVIGGRPEIKDNMVVGSRPETSSKFEHQSPAVCKNSN